MKLEHIITEEIERLAQEGVADKYAYRKWGIPDERADMERQAAMGVKNNNNGELAGVVNDDYGTPESNVYLNPKSLKSFDPDVRAVSDNSGNLFVGQYDKGYYHSSIGNAVQWGGKYSMGYAYDNSRYLTWHRIGTTNQFGLSISSSGYAQKEDNQEDMREKLDGLKTRNPQFTFIPKHWENIKNGWGTQTNDETPDELT